MKSELEFELYWVSQAPKFSNMAGALQNAMKEIAYDAWIQSWEVAHYLHNLPMINDYREFIG